MKKIIITVFLIVRMTAEVMAASEKIKPEVLVAFNSKFASATEVAWVSGPDYYKATFIYYGSQMAAYYSLTGRLKGVTRNISSTELPLYLRNTLQKKYTDYWITSVVEESNSRGFNYYITIENADQKLVLRSTYGNDWETFHKYNKV